LFGIALAAFITGCSSPQPDVDIVAQTLQTYQIGKTTFADFKKDSGLTEAEEPIPQQQSYLPPPALSAAPVPTTHRVYKVVMPWRVYQQSENVSFMNGHLSETQIFVVGDIQHPISILTFNGSGHLTDVSPAPAEPIYH
jgi:hypothetical protein